MDITLLHVLCARLGKLSSSGGRSGSGCEQQLLRTIFGDDEQQPRRGDGDGCQRRYGRWRYAAVYWYVQVYSRRLLCA
jgi:hypothetical protein